MQRCARSPHRDTVTELRVLTAQAACNAISSPIQQLLALCSMGREVPDCLVSSFTWKVSSSYPLSWVSSCGSCGHLRGSIPLMALALGIANFLSSALRW